MELTDITMRKFNDLYEAFSFPRLVEEHEAEGHFPPLTTRQANAAFGRKRVEAWRAEGRLHPQRKGKQMLLFRVSELIKCHESDRALLLCLGEKLGADERKKPNDRI